MIPAGSYVTVIAAGEASGVLAGDLIAARTSAALVTDGFQVTSSKVDDGSVLSQLSPANWLHYLYTLTITVRVPADYGDANDIGAIVANRLYSVTGYYPSAMQAAVAIDAGIIAAPGEWIARASDSVSSAVREVWDAAKSAGNAAQTDTQLVIVGVVLLGAVLIYAVFEGKNTRHLAKLAPLAL